MGYFPIKCIRCSEILTNKTVLFDTEDTTQDMSDMTTSEEDAPAASGNTPAAAVKERSKKVSMWDDDDEDEEVSVNEVVNDTVVMKRYMTCEEIEKYSEQNNLKKCVRYHQHVDVTPDFLDRSNGDEDLLIGVSLQKKQGAPLNRASKRFCPNCKCELPRLSGSMPTYNITVMGTSASGKTVYLSALNWLLSQHQGNLPYSSSLTCISANRANEDFVSKSNQLFENGVLPETTQVLLTDPLVVQMTYNLKNKMKKCLLAISDMRGEDLVDMDGANLQARGKLFSSADAFMVLVSPLNMPYICNNLPNEEGAVANSAIHQRLMANINDYILPNFTNGVINRPTVIMMSKCDVLMNNAQTLMIPPSNAVVAAEPPIKFTGTYFKSQDGGSQTIMRCDPALYSFFLNTFKNKYFTSFSSLGRNVIIEKDENGDKNIQNPNQIKPIRVIDPIIYILICLGFLPEFNKMEVGDRFNQSNVEILSRWIEERT